MSGGSWDYVYSRMEDTAERLLESKCPHRRALGRRMNLMAQAMHEIEWADSHDTSGEAVIPAIKTALGKDATRLALRESIASAKVAQTELALLITDAEANL